MSNTSQFVTSLKSYDKENIKYTTLKKLIKFTNDERFEPESVKTKSRAAMSVCIWVKAIVKYAEGLKTLNNLRSKLEEA